VFQKHTAAGLKSNIFLPNKILGWLRHWHESSPSQICGFVEWNLKSGVGVPLNCLCWMIVSIDWVLLSLPQHFPLLQIPSSLYHGMG